MKCRVSIAEKYSLEVKGIKTTSKGLLYKLVPELFPIPFSSQWQPVATTGRYSGWDQMKTVLEIRHKKLRDRSQ